MNSTILRIVTYISLFSRSSVYTLVASLLPGWMIYGFWPSISADLQLPSIGFVTAWGIVFIVRTMLNTLSHR